MNSKLLFMVLLLLLFIIISCILYSYYGCCNSNTNTIERYENVYTSTSDISYIDTSYNEKTYNYTVPTSIQSELIQDISGVEIPTNPEDIYILPLLPSYTSDTDANYSDYTRSYDSSNILIEYHDEPDSYKETGLPFGSTVVSNASGELIVIEMPTMTNNVLYYEPSNNTIERKNFVPNYEQSILLSRTDKLPSSNYVFERASNNDGAFVYQSTNGSNYSFEVPYKKVKN